LQGETSIGKTSLITWLAKSTGNQCVRINNHEFTDLQDYIGSYQTNEAGKLVFVEGVLVNAVRKGFWIILDELNLAPSDVLEALNRVRTSLFFTNLVGALFLVLTVGVYCLHDFFNAFIYWFYQFFYFSDVFVMVFSLLFSCWIQIGNCSSRRSRKSLRHTRNSCCLLLRIRPAIMEDERFATRLPSAEH
jgi:hypothetical protein